MKKIIGKIYEVINACIWFSPVKLKYQLGLGFIIYFIWDLISGPQFWPFRAYFFCLSFNVFWWFITAMIFRGLNIRRRMKYYNQILTFTSYPSDMQN